MASKSWLLGLVMNLVCRCRACVGIGLGLDSGQIYLSFKPDLSVGWVSTRTVSRAHPRAQSEQSVCRKASRGGEGSARAAESQNDAV